MTNYASIYIVRHGESVWNEMKLLQGQHNSPLTRKGRDQAREMAQKLKEVDFNMIFSSDLARAEQTAHVLALKRKIAVQTTAALRERYFAKFEGRRPGADKELRQLFNEYEKSSPDKKWNFKTGGIESDEEIVSRVITLLREVAVANAGKNVLMVSHGGMMHVLLVHLGFGTHDEVHPWLIDNLAYIKLESDGVDFFIREVHGITKNGTV